MADYHSVIARAVSRLPSRTDEARHAIYERARTALQETLRNHDPPLSEADLTGERSALEVAIERVETELRFSDRRHDAKDQASRSSPSLSFISAARQFVRSVPNKLRSDSLKTAITAGLARGSVFVQRMQSAAKTKGRRIFNIFGDGQWIIKYSQNRIAGVPIVAALVVILLHWIMPENNREAKSYSLISPSELAFNDVTLTHSLGPWEIRGIIKNNSARTVTGLWLKVTVRDCLNDSACVTIGEEIKRIVVNMPPSQTRIINEGDLFSDEMLVPEKLEWSYEIFAD
jgi:hypothetical protein